MYSLEKKQNVNSGLTVKHIGQECETIRLHNTINFESGNLIDYRLPPVADVSTSIEEKKRQSEARNLRDYGCLQLSLLKRVLTILLETSLRGVSHFHL